MKKLLKPDEDQLELDEQQDEELEQEKEPKPLMLFEVHYSLKELDGTEIAGGDAEATLDEELLSVVPQYNQALQIPLQEIVSISRQGYRVIIALISGTQLELSELGRRFEEFWGQLAALHHEQLINDLLMQEALLKTFTEVGFVRVDEAGKELERGECEIRCYETALVIIPDAGVIQRLPFSFISKVTPENYRIAVTLDTGDSFVFRQLGRQYDSFLSTLSGAMKSLSAKTQEMLMQHFANTDAAIVRKAAHLLKDGKAVRKRDLDVISLSLWRQLESSVRQAGPQEAYSFLSSLGHADKSCIGIKRGLMGDLTGEYIWFLVPIFGSSPDSPGNALAMEAISDSGSRATYFFRIMSRRAYAAGENAEDHLERTLRELNYSLYMINFRREPIYLPESKLDARYRFALVNLPELRSVREKFIGRVIHSSPEQWQRDVLHLLQWNVSTSDDAARWSKSR